jgi:hypothetical protein
VELVVEELVLGLKFLLKFCDFCFEFLSFILFFLEYLIDLIPKVLFQLLLMQALQFQLIHLKLQPQDLRRILMILLNLRHEVSHLLLLLRISFLLLKVLLDLGLLDQFLALLL